MADETTNIEIGNYPPSQISEEEVYGPSQRTWSNVNRGFAEDGEAGDYVRLDARLADSRSRPLPNATLDETGETV